MCNTQKNSLLLNQHNGDDGVGGIAIAMTAVSSMLYTLHILLNVLLLLLVM